MKADAADSLVTLARRLLWGGLVVLSASVTGRLQAQISPGPLARAHRELEGATNCAQCHGLKREPMSRMCASCHRDIGVLVERGRGYHGLEGKASKRECAQCHPDHAGAAFEMIEWPGGTTAKFDHRKAGWALEGAHDEAKCESCHTGKYRVSPVAGLSKRTSSAGWACQSRRARHP